MADLGNIEVFCSGLCYIVESKRRGEDKRHG